MPRNKRRRVESDDEASKGSSLTSLPPVESNVDPSNDLAFIPIDSDSDSLAADDIFEVEAILGDTIKEGKMFYHIKWLGYDEVTWEPIENLQCEGLLREYEASKQAKGESVTLSKRERMEALVEKQRQKRQRSSSLSNDSYESTSSSSFSDNDIDNDAGGDLFEFPDSSPPQQKKPKKKRSTNVKRQVPDITERLSPIPAEVQSSTSVPTSTKNSKILTWTPAVKPPQSSTTGVAQNVVWSIKASRAPSSAIPPPRSKVTHDDRASRRRLENEREMIKNYGNKAIATHRVIEPASTVESVVRPKPMQTASDVLEYLAKGKPNRRGRGTEAQGDVSKAKAISTSSNMPPRPRAPVNGLAAGVRGPSFTQLPRNNGRPSSHSNPILPRPPSPPRAPLFTQMQSSRTNPKNLKARDADEWVGRLYRTSIDTPLADICVLYENGRRSASFLESELRHTREIVLVKLLSVDHLMRLTVNSKTPVPNFVVAPYDNESDAKLLYDFADWLLNHRLVAVSWLPKSRSMMIWIGRESLQVLQHFRIPPAEQRPLICACLDFEQPEPMWGLPMVPALETKSSYNAAVLGAYYGVSKRLQGICRGAVYATFAEQDNVEVLDLHALMATYGGLKTANFDLDRVKVVFIHRLLLSSLNYIPNLNALRRRTDISFIVFGTHVKMPKAASYFEPIFPQGGIVSVTLQAILKDVNGFLESLDSFWRGNQHWRLEIHPRLVQALDAEIQSSENDIMLAERLAEVRNVIQDAILAEQISKMETYEVKTIAFNEEDPATVNCHIYWSMLSRQAKTLKEYRRYILIHDASGTGMTLGEECPPGVEVLSPREFSQQVMLPSRR